MSTNPQIAALLENLVPEQDYADAFGIHQRTVARQRQQGLPFVVIGGKVYIDAQGAKRWVENKIVTRNQPRTKRHSTAVRS
jgi:hypothetical protein